MSRPMNAAKGAAAGLFVLVLAGCEGMGMSPPVGNANTVGSPVAQSSAIDCERPDQPTGAIVETPSGDTTAVVETGVGATPETSVFC